jgi:hypothetical protein
MDADEALHEAKHVAGSRKGVAFLHIDEIKEVSDVRP